MKILFVMEDSIPRDNGCPVRNRYLMENLKRAGLDVIGLTSPFMEACPGEPTEGWEVINEIRYRRTQYMNSIVNVSFPLLRMARRVPMFRQNCKLLERMCREEEPDLIHAITSYFNGNAANAVGKKLNIPRLYEVRSIAGSAAAVVDGRSHKAFKYQTVWRLDKRAMMEATRVAPLSEALRDELVRRGLPESKMDVVHNGIDIDNFVPQERSAELVDRYGLRNNVVVGYIGSIRRIEGLSLLVDAAPHVTKQCPHVKFLVIGDGADLEMLKKQCITAGVAGAFVFTGRIPHEEIPQYYSVIDIFVLPRIDALVNQTVAPLKPLEAMATGKAVLASDVTGLAEAINTGKTGMLFKADDVGDLYEKMISLLEQRELRLTIGKAAREWSIKNRQWKDMTESYRSIYEKTLASGCRQSS
jgi:glycosyltransferase involved in cell wall biosynthesis